MKSISTLSKSDNGCGRLITDPAALSAYFDWNLTNVVLGINPTPITPHDSQRVFLMLGCDDLGSEMWVAPAINVAINRGYMLTSSTTPIEHWFAKSGSMCQAQWFGVSIFGGATVSVITVTYRPRLITRGQ